MSYLNYDGLAYFKSKFTNWVDQNYLSKTTTGNTTIAGNVTFTKPITGDVDGKVKKDWLGQKIDETYIKEIATNDNAGTIVYTKGNGSTNHILIDLLQGATPIANGKAGLVPAPTVSEMNYFLRGDGNWAVPTDVYVNQNLIASSSNNQFPVLLSGTSGTPATKTNATVGYTNVVSVNPLTNALMASQFISKHPIYNRQNAVSSKIQYSLNFTDAVSGAGHNLGEVVGYVDTLANGGEHELGLRLFGNPNVQGTEEDYVYMGVGLSKTNVAYGHAPSTPLPADHNEPTDIITRDWLARNGSETGLVHTSMNETIDGIKTFTSETKNTSTAGITTTKLTASGKITGTGTAEISGGSGSTPTLTVNGNESISGNSSVGGNSSVTGNETVGGNISTTNGNISTTNGTISGKTGSIGTGGLAVTGPSNLNGKVTTGNGLDVTGNETVSGTLTVENKITGNGGIDTTILHVTDDAVIDDDLTIGDTVIVNNKILKQDGNTTQEYVSYITNQQETKTTIINNLVNNMIDPDQGLKLVTKGAGTNQHDYIAVKLGSGLSFNTETGTKGQIDVDFKSIPPEVRKAIVNGMVDAEGALIGCEKEFIPGGETYRYYDNNGVLQEATAPEGGIVNPNYGRLTVDFSQMPQDSFIELMSSMIDAQQISSSGGGNHFYVDGINGHDTDAIVEKGHVNNKKALDNLATDNLEVGDYYTVGSTNKIWVWKGTSWGLPSASSRGTPAAPFKTIQACVNLITKVYKFNTTNAYINCQNINETEMLILPSFDRTTSEITIRAVDFNDSTTRGTGDVITQSNYAFFKNSNNESKYTSPYVLKITRNPTGYYDRYCVSVSGTGVWNLQNFNLIMKDEGLQSDGGHQAALHITDYAVCSLLRCRLEFKKNSNYYWTHVFTTGQHVLFADAYALCNLNGYVQIIGNDIVKTDINSYIDGLDTSTMEKGVDLPNSENIAVGSYFLKTTTVNDTTGTVYVYLGSSDGWRSAKSTAVNRRVLNGIQIGDRATVRIQDARADAADALNTAVLDDNNNIIRYTPGLKKPITFNGNFARLVSCNSILTRNLAFNSVIDTQGVMNTDYRFYLYAGGCARMTDTYVINNQTLYHSIDATTGQGDSFLGVSEVTDEDPTPVPIIENADGTARKSYVETETYAWYR